MMREALSENVSQSELDFCLNQLLLCCSNLKMPVLIALQESPSSFRSLTANEQHASGQKLKLLRLLLKSPDIDQFFREVTLEAKKEGHSSLFLMAMGVPSSPK